MMESVKSKAGTLREKGALTMLSLGTYCIVHTIEATEDVAVKGVKAANLEGGEPRKITPHLVAAHLAIEGTRSHCEE